MHKNQRLLLHLNQHNITKHIYTKNTNRYYFICISITAVLASHYCQASVRWQGKKGAHALHLEISRMLSSCRATNCRTEIQSTMPKILFLSLCVWRVINRSVVILTSQKLSADASGIGCSHCEKILFGMPPCIMISFKFF